MKLEKPKNEPQKYVFSTNYFKMAIALEPGWISKIGEIQFVQFCLNFHVVPVLTWLDQPSMSIPQKTLKQPDFFRISLLPRILEKCRIVFAIFIRHFPPAYKWLYLSSSLVYTPRSHFSSVSRSLHSLRGRRGGSLVVLLEKIWSEINKIFN